jgi:light-regulated signal transduction histidine kinase (bacteriophytochrome)
MVGVNLDVTERKENEAALRTLNEKLRRATAELEQYAYAAHHDLQEPIRMVDLYSQMLIRRYPERLDDEAHVYIDFIRTGARRMQSLVADLISYSHVIADIERHDTAVDLNRVVRAAQQSCATMLTESGATVSCGELPVVRGDFDALVTVVRHLISNAIKFRRPEAPPAVRIVAELRGNQWRLAVRDNGVGIKPEYHDRIFGVFKRLHGRDIPGTGMGLATCKKIIEHHGGHIWVESEEGCGATFIFTLPDGRNAS